eukprot:1651245-Amphidinium_carterae.2
MVGCLFFDLTIWTRVIAQTHDIGAVGCSPLVSLASHQQPARDKWKSASIKERVVPQSCQLTRRSGSSKCRFWTRYLRKAEQDFAFVVSRMLLGYVQTNVLRIAAEVDYERVSHGLFVSGSKASKAHRAREGGDT